MPGILLLTGASLVVAAALVVSGFRLLLPHLDSLRPTLLAKVDAYTGLPIKVGALQADWRSFGPTLDARDISVSMEDGRSLSAKRVTLALDVWQSLLHMRWQFRDLTFYQLHVRTNTPLTQNSDSGDLQADKFRDLFLYQFDHFDLRDSTLSFLTLSGQRAELSIPQLTWLNSRNRHRAEGTVNLSSFNGQHGLVSVRMDLRDESGVLNHGTVWMQADDVDVKPWLNKWAQEKVALDAASFSMTAWLNISKGDIAGGNVWLRKGGARWQGDNRAHHLVVDDLMAEITQVDNGWQVTIPSTRIKIDNTPWSDGSLALAWLPQGADKPAAGQPQNGELRVRARDLNLENLTPLLPFGEKFSDQIGPIWRAMQPSGKIVLLAADIPLQDSAKTRFQGQWQGVSWQQWQLIPGVAHLSGTLSGSVEDGQVTARVDNAKMPYQGVFRAPLEIQHGKATLSWKNNADGWYLDGSNIDVAATGVRAAGDFRYSQPQNDQPWLSILAGIATSDGGNAWRYFPENLMGKALVDYLSGAIQGGQADNATLVYGGNPHLFPYKHNEGQFQVWVPLHNATFAFQPDWPALQHFDIDLDFVNDGLWMKTNAVMLGGVKASGLTADIPHYDKDQLLISADIAGPGDAVGPYFRQTPLDDSLGATLEQLQLSGGVNAKLNLDIPLDGAMTTAKGDVTLRDNQLFIKPLNTTLKGLSGKFSFVNGDLQSQPLRASWFNQPVGIDFNTKQGASAYSVGVNLQGDWQPARMGVLPGQVENKVRGSIPWQGKVAIDLPYRGGTGYRVDLNGDLRQFSSQLPAPAAKSAGDALPVNVQVKGDLNHFDLTASAGNNRFNSRWLLKNKLTLDSAILASDAKTTPPLPGESEIELNLPALDGAQWLALFQQGAADHVSSTTVFPSRVTLRTPQLTMGGQQWKNISLISQPLPGGTQVSAEGREINGSLLMRKSGPWEADIKYLYFNPTMPAAASGAPGIATADSHSIDFSRWPALQLRCKECWLWGQKYGRIDGDLAVQDKTLTLSNGLIDTGFAQLTASGEWVNKPSEVRTSLKGILKGKKLNAAADFFGQISPVQDASFNVNYDLHWRDAPWRPQVSSLSGILKVALGKGVITDLGTGRTGQLLRLVSFDALLRKLRFDFSDTFGSGFYFDSIHSTSWIKDGVMHTDDTLVDGLEADIAMQGSVDLVNRRLNMEAVIAPEISATVGVATAFAINPIVGAAVFAASKVLGPIWSKISVLRYRITGPMDKPQVNEVLRQPRVPKKQ
nr:AsmA2 domain-containing protein YhdP [Shimwellia pseudoproteus]